MCRDGLRAAEAARADGHVIALCPKTGAELRSGEFGIWYVADRRVEGSIMLPADAADPPVAREPIRAPGAPRAVGTVGS